MARLNIEEEAWGRIYKLATEQKCSSALAAGVCAMLWHESQTIFKAVGSITEIIEWAGLRSEPDPTKWIESLKFARIITAQENDLFLINGNEIQIASMVAHSKKSAKGGKALQKKLSDFKKMKSSLRSATGRPQDSHRGLNTIQDNTIQSSSNQGNANQDINTSEIKNNSELNKKIWESYRAAYSLRYKVDPVRNAKVNGQIANLGKRLGEDAIEVVRFYLSHNDAFYLKAIHSFDLCLVHAEALCTQWKRNMAVTGADVKRAEKAISQQNQIAEAKAGGF